MRIRIPSGRAGRAAIALAMVAALVALSGCRRRKYENPITSDTQQPDKVLFDKGIREIEKGRYEVARLTLNTLINTYDTSEFLAKAKLAIADSWMREGGSHALAQAEAEYKDFILFYPTMEESAESQMKICEIHYRQMEKPDRDAAHMMRAEEECRQILTQFPNSRFAPAAAQKLRQVQEVLGEAEFRVGSFYHGKGSLASAANRLQNLTDHYPLYSGADQALWQLGDSYSRLPAHFRQRAILAYQRIVRDYPLSPLVEDAKKKLRDMEGEIPEPDPVAYARMKYEKENQQSKGFWGRALGFMSTAPDTTRAARSGQPTMTTLRPTIPVSVPIPGSGQQQGTTDVTASTVTADTGALDTNPDARMNPPGAQGQAAAAEAKPAAGSKPAAAKKQNNKKDSKKSSKK